MYPRSRRPLRQPPCVLREGSVVCFFFIGREVMVLDGASQSASRGSRTPTPYGFPPTKPLMRERRGLGTPCPSPVKTSPETRLTMRLKGKRVEGGGWEWNLSAVKGTPATQTSSREKGGCGSLLVPVLPGTPRDWSACLPGCGLHAGIQRPHPGPSRLGPECLPQALFSLSREGLCLGKDRCSWEEPCVNKGAWSWGWR